MNKYRVYLQAIANLSVEVEAEDPDEALELAFEQHGQYLCAQCSGWGENWSLDIREWEAAGERDGAWSIDDAVEEVRGAP